MVITTETAFFDLQNKYSFIFLGWTVHTFLTVLPKYSRLNGLQIKNGKTFEEFFF
jgi:hypothetical protein